MLDLVLAPTNLEDFQVGIVLESTNTTFESTSELLESMSKKYKGLYIGLQRVLLLLENYDLFLKKIKRLKES